ncbi:MAG: hypothetical protein BGO07_00010 [Alphaproteobacteria bacterium 40-19]|nr:MAG: hypothetical protein BGO07_00010 [Alphaproteobacteria bacterium 40-19]
MKENKVLAQTPGHTVYAGPKESEVYHYFTDLFRCPVTAKEWEIPGKGVINHRLSAFCFSRLEYLGIATHFIRTVNMRQSLMYATASLPFDVEIHFGVTSALVGLFELPEGHVFERPVINYFHTASGKELNESYLISLDYLHSDEWEDFQTLIYRATDILKGVFIGHGLQLMKMTLSLGKSETGFSAASFFLSGKLCPESFCVLDLETKTLLGAEYISNSDLPCDQHYQRVASRMGIVLEGPMRSHVLNFKKKQDSLG